MDGSTIASMLTTALTRARAAVGAYPTQQQLHRARSRAWVTALAAEFRRRYSEDAVRVFTQSDSDNRLEFGCNELTRRASPSSGSTRKTPVGAPGRSG